MILHVCSTPSCLVKRVVCPDIAACRGTWYGVGPSPPTSANSMSNRIGAAVLGPPCGRRHDPYPGRRVELDHGLVGLRSPVECREPETRRVLEDHADLRLGDGESLARSDEERHARPAPVVDVEAERCVRLGGRVRCDAVDREVALVLPADVVGRVGLGDRAVEGDLASSSVLTSPPAGGSIAVIPTTCMRWLTTTSRSAPTGS